MFFNAFLVSRTWPDQAGPGPGPSHSLGPWPQAMALGHGLKPWPLAMAFGLGPLRAWPYWRHGLWPWPSTMTMTFGHAGPGSGPGPGDFIPHQHMPITSIGRARAWARPGDSMPLITTCPLGDFYRARAWARPGDFILHHHMLLTSIRRARAWARETRHLPAGVRCILLLKTRELWPSCRRFIAEKRLSSFGNCHSMNSKPCLQSASQNQQNPRKKVRQHTEILQKTSTM